MKSLSIALKDTLIAFRDRNALMLMFAAPLMIALVMGLAFGGAANDTSPISEIPVVIVNFDEGDLGGQFAEIITSIEVNTTDGEEGLFAVTEMNDIEAAKQQIEDGSARGVIAIPAGFSAGLQTAGGESSEGPAAVVQVYTDPAATISPGIVRGVVDRIATGFNTVVIANLVTVDQVLDAVQNPDVAPAVLANLEQLDEILAAENAEFGETAGSAGWIEVAARNIGEGEGFNLLNYFVPSMAILFLMFSVLDGARSILDEERDGTLQRLMSTPSTKSQIILGKIGGTFLTGILQFVILVAASGLLFGVDWGKEPLGITLMVLATVAAATSLGTLIASFARTVNQAAVLGSTVTLVFAILGGNFIDFRATPAWLVPVSKLTINRWALEGFFNLTFLGQTLGEVAPNLLVLFSMAAVFFGLSVFFFNRRFVG